MTSASVAFHESKLSLHADTPVLCSMCVHYGKMMRHRKPNERKITCTGAAMGRPRAAATASPAVPSQPCQLLGLAGAAVAPRPRSPEAADSRHTRNHRQQTGPLILAGPSKHCVLVTCHLLLFAGLTTRQVRVIQFCMRHKRERLSQSWQGLSLLRFIILRKSRHMEKYPIKSQQKQC